MVKHNFEEKKITTSNSKANNLHILNKYSNKNVKLIPLKVRRNFLGDTKYLPPIAKEWKNSIYVFNKNNNTNISMNNVNINSLIQHYFNLRFIPSFISKKYKPRWVRRPSMNKIYVSNAEIKHTNSKSILTIYTYNREKIALLNKVKFLRKRLLKNIKLLIIKNKEYLQDTLSKTIKTLLERDLSLLRKYKLRLNLNKYKFEEKLVYMLNNIVGNFFNKKVQFNIVNMRSIILNSDIFTNILADKLWKKKINPLKMMSFILSKAVLPNVNRIVEKTPTVKSIDFNLIDNKYKDLRLNSILINNNNLDLIIKELYNNILFNDFEKNTLKMSDSLFNSIRYKNMSGVRLEIKGRLTKRYRADRAIFKVKWKGGLKNIYSSYKGLSVMKMRGQISSNMEYSLYRSKRRIGAFAVKGWVSGK